MTPSTERRFGGRGRRWLAAGLVLAAGLLCCTLRATPSAAIRDLVPPAVADALDVGHDSARLELQVTEESALAPFLHIVPTTDGDLWIADRRHIKGRGIKDLAEGLVGGVPAKHRNSPRARPQANTHTE